MTDHLDPSPTEQAATLNELFRDLGWKIRLQVSQVNERDWAVKFNNANLIDIDSFSYDHVRAYLMGVQAGVMILGEVSDEEE